MSNVFKTEAEIIENACGIYKSFPVARSGFVNGYLKAQDDLRPHIETLQDAYNAIHEKCALLEQATSEVVLRNKELEDKLQEMFNYQDMCIAYNSGKNNIIDVKYKGESAFISSDEFVTKYQQSKTQNK